MRRLLAAVVALLVLAPQPAGADTLEPVAWPPELGLGSAPNAIRYGGVDRYHTGLAVTYALRGTGGFPFDTPDRTTGVLWGAATCPKAVIVVAGDTPADALAAAPLSDPTNLSNEPRLVRVAAADPFFDVIGGADRVDTNAAPIIVTTSARSGARGLAAPARTAVADLRAGGCSAAREAIIVGGEAAVPVEVESELVELGYEEVFRVAGADRFETAARVAAALGTEPAPAGGDCVDEDADDGSTAMGFYGNAVIEYRPDAASCQLQGRAVILADGAVGADALAAGWWASYWQVPILLVAGDGSLPPATRSALQTMDIDTIVVLGGTARIPEAVVEEAARLATAVVGRFAGADRYATSVATAVAFGGWHATGEPRDFEGDRVCLAASSGANQGWPDALAAGPWCGRLSAQPQRRSPSRVLEPVTEGGSPLVPGEPAHHAVPVLLVPAGAAPTSSVSSLLSRSFPAGGEWCRGATTIGCREPGFAVAFGGSAVVADATLASVSASLAGGDAAQRGADPALTAPFRTGLDLAPVYLDDVVEGAPRGCAERDGIAGARWLAAYAEPALVAFVGALDLTRTGGYVGDESVPMCIGLGASPASSLVAVSAAGRASRVDTLEGGPERTVSMSDALVQGDPQSSDGDPASLVEPGATTSWTYRDVPASPVDLVDGEQRTRIDEAGVLLVLTQAGAATPSRFDADVELDVGAELVTGQATGEAVRSGTRWELAGRFRMAGATGGFRATVETHGTPENDDDQLTWRFDAVRP